MKHTILFLLTISLFFGSCKNQRNEELGSQKPNILFLLADDLGYGELGSYGQKIINTPVLDSLAANGMRFTDFYAGNAVCSPSRAVLMTGKHSGVNTIRGNSGYFNDDRWMRVALKKDEITIGEILQEIGYQTAFFGKWHLDDPNDLSTWACNRGFDYAIQEQWASRYGGLKFTIGMEYVNAMVDSVYYDKEKWNCHDEFRTNITFDYLDKIDKDKPFFLFMSYRAPHAHERYISNKDLYAENGWPEKERMHAAKITLLDKQIGRMLKKLDEMGELNNTLVLFTSDNGPHNEGGHNHDFFNSNGDLQGYKRDLYEGGIRVPLIAYWKGKIKPGTVTNHIGGFQDIMATLAEVAGVETPHQSNGISILPVLTGKSQPMHDYLNWEIQLDGYRSASQKGYFRQSSRLNNWKAIRYGINSETELYNLNEDISESNNIASEHPEMVNKFNRLFEESRTENDHFPYGGIKKEEKSAFDK
ncbi:MAG: sulfatase-like hydrolase/transferase [Bacteroidales bacterium]|nr:sulfatase-like hydrolase/transferase [Bacteroidales bacterium]